MPPMRIATIRTTPLPDLCRSSIHTTKTDQNHHRDPQIIILSIFMDRHVRVTTWNDRWSISSQKTFNLFQARPFTFPWEQLPVKKDGPCSWTISLRLCWRHLQTSQTIASFFLSERHSTRRSFRILSLRMYGYVSGSIKKKSFGSSTSSYRMGETTVCTNRSFSQHRSWSFLFLETSMPMVKSWKISSWVFKFRLPFAPSSPPI